MLSRNVLETHLRFVFSALPRELVEEFAQLTFAHLARRYAHCADCAAFARAFLNLRVLQLLHGRRALAQRLRPRSKTALQLLDFALLVGEPDALFVAPRVIFETEHFVGFAKPHDFRIDSSGTRCTAYAEPTLAQFFRAQRSAARDSPVHFCNQLDFATSGAILLAKDARAKARCTAAFQRRAVEKEYVALLLGHVNVAALANRAGVEALRPEAFYVRVRVASTNGFAMRLATAGGKACSTECEVLRRSFVTCADARVPVTRVRFRPLTGRRHQLRLTACHIGHPILGDLTYGPQCAAAPQFVHACTSRMYLHSAKLRAALSDTEVVELLAESPF